VPAVPAVVLGDAVVHGWNPQAVAELYRLLQQSKQAAGLPAAGEIDTAPFGKEANRPCLELLISYAVQQHLVPRPLAVDELW